MAENVSPTEKRRASESAKSVIERLRTRDIPRLEAMLTEQKASGALKKDIAETQKWLNSAKRHCKGIEKSIQELKKWGM